MNIKSKTLYLSIIYAIVAIAITAMTIMNNRQPQVYIKPFIAIVLGVLYVTSVKKINPIYILALLAVLITHYLLIFHESYFIYTLYGYLALHILTALLIYKDFLINKSFFDIITFGSPYFMAFLTIFLLIFKNLDGEIIPIFIFGAIASINGSVVLLNYSQKEDIGSYLLFIGVIIIFGTDILSALYKYNGGNIIYYQLMVIFDVIGQYIICRGIILAQEKSENDNENLIILNEV